MNRLHMLAAAAAARKASSEVYSVPTDPYWANVIFLLSMTGTNGSTTFTDLKGLLTWTASGNAQISTANAAFTGGSGLFDGTGDYIRTPANALSGLGTGDYTIEGYGYQATNSSDRTIFDNRGASDTGIGIYLSQSAVNQNFRLTLASNTVGIAGTSTAQFTNNTKQHWSVSKQSGVTYGHIDGVLVWSVTDSRTLAASPAMTIGANYVNTQGFLGNAGWIRGTKGVGRYGSGNFTPPTTPYPTA